MKKNSLRKKGRKIDASLPLISIITVTYNAKRFLQRTIDSIRGIDYPNIEYIIVDGNSSDGTKDIINKHLDVVSKWISEKDNGLYDAMNKGIVLSTGVYVWFVNAGDTIFNSDTIVKLIEKLEPPLLPDVIYGESMFVDDWGMELGLRSELTTHKLPKKLYWKDMNLGMVVSHQSFIVRRDIAPRYIENNLTADIDWVIKVLKESNVVFNSEMVLSKYLIGGISKQHFLRSMKDRYIVLSRHFGLLPTFFNHITILLRHLRWKLSK